MKIIGFVSSPRKNNSNTRNLVSKALDFASEKGCEIKLVELSNMNLKGCIACEYCKEHQRCVIEDDFQSIYNEIFDADAFIFGSPIYFFDINSQAKVLEDRFYSFIKKDFTTKLPNKKNCIFIYSQNNPDIKSYEVNLSKHDNAFSLIGLNPLGKLIHSENNNDPDEIKKLQQLVSLLIQK